MKKLKYNLCFNLFGTLASKMGEDLYNNSCIYLVEANERLRELQEPRGNIIRHEENKNK